MLVRFFNAHVSACTATSRHLALRPRVLDRLVRAIRGRDATYEVSLDVSKFNVHEIALFRAYSDSIRLHGLVRQPELVAGEVFLPLADARPRYAARGSAAPTSDGGASHVNVDALLPTCIAGCLVESGRFTGERVDWIRCHNECECVSFREGWAHTACVFPRSRPPDGEWVCFGCESGAPSAMTIFTAGDGVRRVGEGTPHNRVLFFNFESLAETGDFPDAAALASGRRRATAPTPVRRIDVAAAVGRLSIDGAMCEIAGAAVGEAIFQQPNVRNYAVDHFCITSARDPTAPRPSLPTVQRKTAHALELVRRALGGVADGTYGRSRDAARAAAAAAAPLCTRLRELFADRSSIFSAWRLGPAALSVENPFAQLPVDTIDALAALLGVTARIATGSLAAKLEWHNAAAQWFDTLRAALHDGEEQQVSALYARALGFPASFWLAEYRRVFERGDFTSRLHEPSAKSSCADGRFAPLPYSYVCLLYALHPVAAHYCEKGEGERIVFAYYLGMSDALKALLRLFVHGTSSGNKAVHELWFRKSSRSETAYAPADMPAPVLLARFVGFTPRPVGAADLLTPAGRLECVVGAAGGFLGPLTPSCNTSPHGDHGLLFHEHVRQGRRPVAPLALVFLAESAVARGGDMSALIDAEPSVLMLEHLRVVAAIVKLLPEAKRGPSASDGRPTLWVAWAWLVGADRVRAALRTARPTVPRLIGAGQGAVGAALDDGAEPAATAPQTGAVGAGADANGIQLEPAALAGDGDATAGAAAGGAGAGGAAALAEPQLSARARAFLARAHLQHSDLNHFTALGVASSRVGALLRLLALPKRVTPGAPRVTNDDVSNAVDAVARSKRGGATVHESLLQGLADLAEHGWAVVKSLLDAQVCRRFARRTRDAQ